MSCLKLEEIWLLFETRQGALDDLQPSEHKFQWLPFIRAFLVLTFVRSPPPSLPAATPSLCLIALPPRGCAKVSVATQINSCPDVTCLLGLILCCRCWHAHTHTRCTHTQSDYCACNKEHHRKPERRRHLRSKQEGKAPLEGGHSFRWVTGQHFTQTNSEEGVCPSTRVAEHPSQWGSITESDSDPSSSRLHSLCLTLWRCCELTGPGLSVKH